MRTLVLALLLLSCKRDTPQVQGTAEAGSPEVPGTSEAGSPEVPGTPDAGDGNRTLPPPSEEVGRVPEEIAKGVKLEVVAEDLARPVLATFAPGDARRMFVLEQHVGRVRIVEGGKVAKKPFLDLKGKVSTGNEQGLLGMAFHPDYASNRRFFVYYTDRKDHTHVVEYRASADPAVADPEPVREIFFLEQPYSNHNGGHLEFGPDGKLYVGLGDGGAAGDPHRAGQDPENLLAKLLRFDVDAGEPKPEIVAMGLRNPWRFDFDGKTGDLYIGDVGQNEWEYVHVAAAGELDGKNFGWNVVEGRHCYRRKSCDTSKFTLPVAEYSHEEGCSITGGVVYRGKALPALDGVYFYADYCTALLRSFRWAKDGIRQHWDWKPVLDPDARLSQISSFGVDGEGEIYVVSLSGTIWKMMPR